MSESSRENVELRPAAGVILWREGKIYLVVRSGNARFFPGFHSFPGGSVDLVDGRLNGVGDGDEISYRSAAVRELFEETGILLAGGNLPSPDVLYTCRKALLEGKLDWDKFLLHHGLCIPDEEQLRSAGRWITPPYSPLRFKAQFFLAFYSGVNEPSLIGSELQDGDWYAPDVALRKWEEGKILLAVPTLITLRYLHEYGPVRGGELLQARDPRGGLPYGEVPLSPGLSYLPVRTKTFSRPPYTNVVFVGGERILLVDPGADTPEELDKLESYITYLEHEHGKVIEVILTHHHHDHIAAVRYLKYPVAASPQTLEKVSGQVELLPSVREIHGGETWQLGTDVSGRNWTVTAVQTPGHTAGHLSLWDCERKFLVAGDLISGSPQGSVLIHPQEGSMSAYLDSLRRVNKLGCRVLLPAHGTPYGPGSSIISKVLKHRLDREEQILSCLRERPMTLGELLPRVYGEIGAIARKPALWSLESHLLKLQEDGMVVSRSGVWELAKPSTVSCGSRI